MFIVTSVDDRYVYIDTGAAEPAGYLRSRVSYENPAAGDDIVFTMKADGSFTIDRDPASLKKQTVEPDSTDLSTEAQRTAKTELSLSEQLGFDTEEEPETKEVSQPVKEPAVEEKTEPLSQPDSSEATKKVSSRPVKEKKQKEKKQKTKKDTEESGSQSLRPNAREGFQISGVVVAALVIGVIAILANWIPYFRQYSVWVGILASVLALIGLIQAKGRLFAVLVLLVAGASIPISMFVQKLVRESDQAVQEARADSTAAILAQELDISFGSWSDVTNEAGLHTTSVPVKITAKKDVRDVSYTIHIEALSPSGQPVADSYLLVENLGQGQTSQQNAFAYVEENALEAMKTASFRVDEISRMAGNDE
jgi:hypothetical protein